MQDADGVIFAPVYGMNVSGLFKVFVDRFAFISIARGFLIRKHCFSPRPDLSEPQLFLSTCVSRHRAGALKSPVRPG
jgi:hypothetical protein